MRLGNLGRWVFALLQAGILVFVPACSNSLPGSCKANSGCGAGEICSADECFKICSVQRDCESGQLCQHSVCVTPAGDSPPTITLVVGNSAVDVTRVTDGVVVAGVLLADADFELRGAASDIPLVVRSQSATGAELILPEDVVSGRYLLVATNQSGSDQAEVTLTLPEVTGTMIIDKVNGSGTTGTFAVNHLPVGSLTNQVAAGNHHHSSLYSTSSHSHDADYVNVTGDAISGDLTVAGNVGIGTTMPATALDVAGEVRIASTGLACDATSEGALRYDSTSKAILVCDGTGWGVPPGTVTGGCAFGACWGGASSVVGSSIVCSAGSTARVFTWCATTGICNWNSAGSWPHGVCIQN